MCVCVCVCVFLRAGPCFAVKGRKKTSHPNGRSSLCDEAYGPLGGGGAQWGAAQDPRGRQGQFFSMARKSTTFAMGCCLYFGFPLFNTCNTVDGCKMRFSHDEMKPRVSPQGLFRYVCSGIESSRGESYFRLWWCDFWVSAMRSKWNPKGRRSHSQSPKPRLQDEGRTLPVQKVDTNKIGLWLSKPFRDPTLVGR